MAIDHSSCNHPRTPAGRAACRRAGGPGSTPQKPHMTDAEIDEIMLAPAKPRVRKATGGGRSNKPAIEIKVTGRKAKADPNRILRANADTMDVPPVFRPAISHAWKHNWVVLKGSPYHAGERVVTIESETGVASLTWACNNPHGITKVAFRPAGTSVTSVVPSVNEVLRKLDGESS